MKRFHVNVSIDDPRIKFAISTHGGRTGIEDLGLPADNAEELAEIRRRLAAAGAEVSDEPGANSCYAHSDKHWAVDPQGIAWEAFHTLGEARHYGDDHGPVRQAESACGDNGCCAS